MTNITIPNVPRELLERILGCIDAMGWERLEADIRALLSAPSPAGVDGLEVVGYVSQDDIKWQGDCTMRLKPYSDYTIPLCRLSDAQAIIDGLRGEVGAQRVKTCAALKARNDAREERDQQAKRIGELARCLKFARTTMSVIADNANLRGVEHRSLISEVKRIDAALSEVDK